MALKITRRIRGNLHGSIDCSELEDLVLAHPILQRLRRIKQTAFLSMVFPGASHSRFEHSLGVMYQASVAWSKLRDNQKRLHESSKKYNNFATGERSFFSEDVQHGLLSPTFEQIENIFSSDYAEQTVRLAALMHDVGHPPFSHSGERFLPELREVLAQNDLPPYIKSYIEDQIEKKGDKAKSNHEIFTIILIVKILEDVYLKHPNVFQINPQDVVSVIIPEIRPSENSELLDPDISDLCHELVSGEVDIDRMDYLLRDSKECGVVYGLFDVERIMDSLAIYYNLEDKRFHLAIQYSGLAAFEDYLRARQSMYIQLYFHKTSVAGEAMLQYIGRKLRKWTLPAKLSLYSSIDESNILNLLLDACSHEIADKKERTLVVDCIKDLLLNRKMWKRVYEWTCHVPKQDNLYIDKAVKILRENKLEYEHVSSKTLLTKFSLRKKTEGSKNYLRLIKRDGGQFLRVVPIEDYSTLISQKNYIQIDRLYIKAYQDEKDLVQSTKSLIMEALTD